jgi:hypothetical protein
MSTCISSACDSHTHTISGHRCLRCGVLGHDEVECSNFAALTILEELKDIKTIDEDEWCKIKECNFKHTHETKDHTCNKCGLTHINEEILVEEECFVKGDYTNNIYNMSYIVVTIDTIKSYYEFSDNIYLICFTLDYKDLVIRKKDGVYNFLILDNEEANQIFNRFIFGVVYINFNYQTPDFTIPFVQQPINYTTNTLSTTQNIFEDIQAFDLIAPINEDYINSLLHDIIKCPICRAENTIEKIYPIKGAEDRCSVCYENKVEHFFSVCGHACVCKSCFEQL